MLNAMKGKNKVPQKSIIRKLDLDWGGRLLQEVNFQLRPKGSAGVRQGAGGTTRGCGRPG